MNKKTTISIIIVLVGILGFTGLALAASDFTVSVPSGTSYELGDTFTASISVSPSEKVYTIGAQLSYPANLLKVESFNFASTWMPMLMEGYDSIDNTNGLLIKTAGYAGGIDSVKTLGTVTFKALNSGQATIQLTSDTFALNAVNANVTGNLGSAQISIEASEVVPEEETTPEVEVIPEEETTPEEVIPEEETTPEEETPEEVIPEEEVTLEEEDITSVSGLAAIIDMPFNLKALLIIVVAAIIGLIVLRLVKKRKTKE